MLGADDAHAEAATLQPARLELGGDERAATTVRGELPDNGLYAAVLVEADPLGPEAQIAARTQGAPSSWSGLRGSGTSGSGSRQPLCASAPRAVRPSLVAVRLALAWVGSRQRERRRLAA